MEPTPWLLSQHQECGYAEAQRAAAAYKWQGLFGALTLTVLSFTRRTRKPSAEQTEARTNIAAFLHFCFSPDTLGPGCMGTPTPSRDTSSSRFPHTSTNTAPYRAPSNTVGPQKAAKHSLKGREDKENQRGVQPTHSSCPQAPASPPSNGQAAGKQDRDGHCDGKAQFPSPETLKREDSAEQELTGTGIHPGTVTDTGDTATDAPSHPNATSPRSPECCHPPAGGVGCWTDEWFCGPQSSASPRWRRRSAPASPGEGESAAVSGVPTGTTTPNSTSTGHVPKLPQAAIQHGRSSSEPCLGSQGSPGQKQLTSAPTILRPLRARCQQLEQPGHNWV